MLFERTTAQRPCDPSDPCCCLCSGAIDPVVARLQANLQPRIIRALVANFPQWTPEHDLCPECAAQVVAFANRERKNYNVQHDFNLPYPVFSKDEIDIVPSPQRVFADRRHTGQGITVAFLDSGFSAHPDVTEPNDRITLYVDATGARPQLRERFESPPTSINWHGTMTSAIALGNGQASLGRFAGLAPDANLIAVKTGYRGKRISEADILRALTWVVDNRAKHDIRVVNISLGGDRQSEGAWTPLDEMIEEAVAQGLVVVCASGNDGRFGLVPPASAPSAITVGGLDDQNTLIHSLHGMYRSSWGKAVDGAPKPELVAPAMWVAAPMVRDTPTHEQAQFLFGLHEANDAELRAQLAVDYARARFSQDMASQPIDVIRRQLRGRMNEDKLIHRHYQHVDGTSMAAPFVTGTVAQMLQANPKLSPAQVKQILLETAQPLHGVPSEQQGRGVLNAGAAVARALRHQLPATRRQSGTVQFGKRGEVTFTLCDPQASSVALVGGFNAWRTDTHRLGKLGKGVWQIKTRLAAGTYRYKFVLDQNHWLRDFENPRWEEDGCGGFFSLLDVAA